MVTNGSTMKLGEIREKAFDVVPVLASVSCITYSVFSAADASVDQGEPLGSSLAVVLGGCQKGLLRERRNGGLVDGNYVFHFDQGEPQNVHTLHSIPAKHFNSSSVHDKVYIVICKVL